MAPGVKIALAESDADVADVKALFREYAAFLGVDRCFLEFDREMETFPAFYDFLMLARVDGAAAGAIGLKNLGDRRCEMKRLYVRPEFHGAGLGRALTVAFIEEARKRGYARLFLDTAPKLTAAIALYRDLGFVDMEKYYENPEEGAIYMALDLKDAS